MRYLIITKLFFKRFIKNPAFLFILLIMPLLVILLSNIEGKDERNIRVGVYSEKDKLSLNICNNLKNKDGYIKFIPFDSKDEMVEEVENKKIECGYIFPSDFKNRLDDYNIKRSITCIESPSTILSNISDEVVFAEVIKEYGKNIAANFVKENNIAGNNISDEDVAKVYEKFNTSEYTFSIEYKYIESDGLILSGNDSGAVNYMVHGIISILILISGLFGAIKWFEDEKIGLYASFNNIEKVIIGFISIFVPTAIMSVSGILTIYISNTYTNMLREGASMILYILLVTGFSYLIKLATKSGTDICMLLPALTLGSLIFCPVFADISKFVPYISGINKIFPTFYYLNEISKGSISSFIISLMISMLLISSGFVINFLKER